MKNLHGFTPYHFQSESDKGFTLIETLVAITIITLSIAGPLVTANRSIVAAQTARDQLIASYLAQEGIEYMRAVRDDAFIDAIRVGTPVVSDNAWNNFLSFIAPCVPNSCTLDTIFPPTIVPYVSSPPPLYLTNCTNGPTGRSCSSPNYYTQQSAPSSVQTPFKRTIQAVPVSATDVRIISTVTWVFHSTTYTVSITNHLTKWQ